MVELKDGHKLDCFSLFYSQPKEDWKLLHRTKVLMDEKTYQVLSRYLCKWVLQQDQIVGVMLKPRPGDEMPDIGKLSLESAESAECEECEECECEPSLGDKPKEDTPEEECCDDDDEHASGAESS